MMSIDASADGARMSRLPDRDAREAIVTDLGRNLIVEASAGSGKTEALARRMAAGIAVGAYRVEGMAAVTFTRKAAAELRGRFQQTLERRLREEPDDAARARIGEALRHLERFFAGTIHAFCARLLRERPVEAEVAPGFTELDEVGGNEQRRRAWRNYVARARALESDHLLELQGAGLQVSDLDEAFDTVCLFEEVDFPAGDHRAPEPEPAWRALDDFWERLEPKLPRSMAPDTKCQVQQRARECRWRLRTARRDRLGDLFTLLSLWERDVRVTQKWWTGVTSDTQPLRRDIETLVEGFQAETVRPYLARWRHHVYRLAIAVLTDARAFARQERLDALTLDYGDLLQRAAGVLRQRPDVRRALQQKYRWLFVDEFQDTDPIQAEVLVLLASDDATPTNGGRPTLAVDSPLPEPLDWTRATPRAGALFIVGDPKQSIYRFRRADIEVYDRVCDIVERHGGRRVRLTTSFRSVPEVCTWLNEVFDGVFPAAATPQQPAFHALEAVRDVEKNAAGAVRGVRTLTTPSTTGRSDVAVADAAAIARYIRGEIDAGRRRPGDFLVLTWVRKRLVAYADALEQRQVPLEVSGAGAFGESAQVRVLAELLRALSDPDDGIATVAVLRGPLFGISDEDLFHHRQAGGGFRFTAPSPPAAQPPAGARRQGTPPSGKGSEGRPLPTAQLSLLDTLVEPEVAAGSQVGADARIDRETDRSGASHGPVVAALEALRTYHRWVRRLPAGAAIERILESTGYLALAAVETPGGPDAGDLLHAVDRIRQVTEQGGTLAEAAAALDREVDSSEVESLPLEPGRGDVVRLMNLHKAKGLEAPVVFLADPCGGWSKQADIRIERDGGRALGFFQITRRKGMRRDVLAEPEGWAARAAVEQAFVEKEEDRLRYVAATRARDLLVVSRWEKPGKARPWGAFESHLLMGTELRISPGRARVGTEPVDLGPGTRARATAARASWLDAASRASWTAESVTGSLPRELPLREDDPARLLRGPASGMAWGELVHKLLEHAVRGGRWDRLRMERLARWLTLDRAELHGAIPEALAVVEQVVDSDLWREVLGSDQRFGEVPFTICTDDPALGRRVLHGVIDLVYRTTKGWRIVDHKTDQLVSSDGSELVDRHAAQVRIYADAWSRVSPGTPVEVGIHAVRAGVTHWLREAGGEPAGTAPDGGRAHGQ